jgi:hypothetical protein
MKHFWLYLLLAFIAGGLVGFFGYRAFSPGVPLVANITNVVYETNYGTLTSYIKVPNYTRITNWTELTNIRVYRTDVSNLVTVTNTETLTITNIIEIIADYTGFFESPFVFRQSNELLTVQLYKRSADYKIRAWRTPKRHTLGLYYPPMLSYQYAPFGESDGLFGSLSLGGYLGYINSNIAFGIGLGFQF